MKYLFTLLVYPKTSEVALVEQFAVSASLTPQSVHHGPRGSSYVYKLKLKSLEQAAEFERRVRDLGVSYGTAGRFTFTTKELLDAPAAVIAIERAPTGGVARQHMDVVYDWDTGCPRCWSGAIQLNDLILSELVTKPSATLHQTLDGTVLVRLGLADLMRSHGFALHTRPVFNNRQELIDDWVQPLSRRTLPPLPRNTPGLTTEVQCPVCLRDGFYGTPQTQLLPKYGADVIQDLREVSSTWEVFGRCGRSESERCFATPQSPILVWPRRAIELLLRHNRDRAVKLSPVY